MDPIELLHLLENEAGFSSQKWALLEGWINRARHTLDECEGLLEGLSDGSPDALPMHKQANRLHGQILNLLNR